MPYKPRLTLTRQVLILVLMPLMVQIGFMTFASRFQSEAEEELQKSLHAKAITDGVNRLSTTVYDIFTTYGGEAALQMADDNDPTYLTMRRNLDRELADLKRICAGEEALTESANKLESNVARSIKVLKELKKHHDRTGDAGRGERKAMWHELRNYIKDLLFNDIASMADKQKNLAEKSPQIQSDMRKKLQQIMLIGAGLNLIVTLLIAIYITRQITGRLARVSDNAYRLASNVSLNPPLRGKDEIAELDRTFHQMAQDLAAANQAREDIIAMITHDLRTPLTTLKNILAFLSTGKYGTLDEAGLQYLATANNNINKMTTLVNDLLDSEKLKAGKAELDIRQVELDDSFEMVLSMVSGVAQAADVTIEIPPTDLIVRADAESLDRVLLNLVSNAVKYSPRGEKVSVTAERRGESALIKVSDHGPGIAKEDLPFVFERFQQAGKKGREDREAETRTGGSSGLGLTIAKALVEMQGGEIWVENEFGAGASFYFTLPI